MKCWNVKNCQVFMLNTKIMFLWILLLIGVPYCHALKGKTYKNVPDLFKGMVSKDFDVRRKAWEDAKTLEESDIPALFKEVENEDPNVCAIAIEMLVRTINDKDYEIATLKNFLKSKRNIIRQGAALNLIYKNPSMKKELMPILIETLKSEVGILKWQDREVVRILGEMGPEAKDAVPVIIEALKREPNKGWHYMFCDKLTGALVRIGTPKALEACKGYYEEQEKLKRYYAPYYYISYRPSLSFLVTFIVTVLFLWSRIQNKKGNKLICWPLLIPAFFWGIWALITLLDPDPFGIGIYRAYIYHGWIITILVGLIPWLISIQRTRKQTMSKT